MIEISASPVQKADWDNVAELTLPTGQPILTHTDQVDLDMVQPIEKSPVTRFNMNEIAVSIKKVPGASFEINNTVKQFNHWSRVKAAQYELNTLSDIRHFSPRQGLPTGSVYETVQGKDGHLWLATNGEGLCQYIANHFRCFNDSHGLSNNRVWDIEKMPSGELILATDKGINIYDGAYFKSLTVSKEEFKEKVSDVAIVSDTVYFTTGSQLYQYHQNVLYKIMVPDGFGIINHLEADQNTLLLATSSGLYRFYEGALSQLVFDKNCQGHVSFATSSKQKIAFSIVGSGVCIIDKVQQLSYLQSGEDSLNVTALLLDESRNTLWIGDDSKGVFKVRNEHVYAFNKQNGLSDQHIRGLMQDAQGHVWVSTYGAGINRIKDSGFRLLTKRSGLHRERVSAMANINDKLWLGQYGTGIQVLDKGQWMGISHSLYNQYIHTIAQDAEGRVWVGSRQGVIVLGSHDTLHIWHQMGLEANIIHQIATAPDGCMYIASEKGLYRACENTLQFLNLEQQEYVIDVYIDKTNKVWFVTNGGGTYFIDRGVVYRFTERDGLPSDWAYSLEQGSDGTVFIGTRKGVFALKWQAGSWIGRHIRVDDGLSSHIVLGLKIHQGELWVGTERGNNRIRLTDLFISEQPLQVDSFVYENGYLAVDATLNTAEFINNTFYWGSGSGVTYFDPTAIDLTANLATSILEVSSLSRAGTHLHAPIENASEEVVEFSPETLQITFRVSHKDWANPERVLYQTRLLGSSELWSEPSESSEIAYNHLGAGEYEFQVRAMSSRKFGEHVSYQFTILTPWWQTWWAYTLAACSLLLVMYQTIKWRFSFLAKQQRIKDRAEFSEALLERKKQLLAEVSHEIRTPLSVLKMSVEGLEYNLLEDTEKTYQLLHRRIADINMLVADIDQLARTELEERALCPEYVAVKPWLTSWSQDAKGRILQRDGYEFDVDIKINDALIINADVDRLTQVLTNLLSNSIRYTAKPAQIVFTASLLDGALVLSLSDSSPGVLDSELKTIFERMYQSEKNKELYKGGTGLGLAICQDLVERHGGCIFAEHSVLGGVKVTIVLPVLP
ncbi:two-component regulator propeller domain-containing protein [Pseudoalteromonas luteoviolacea]|uniref:two-component regulator propeller domain-containing protein n=1 Tax=Pseudoalteromonas luteoviolacea TaxID=43657 RepID=UPI00114ED10A|nr:two-component regulator propeller domain-containing protein [Pseudoalteromonas luteoviolacea]TQF67342.1 hypothetical protein FLM44_19325 [Pseudoalteromonas luteoviolacea]